MRAYIIADMVGACGIWRKRQCQVGSREWRQARRLLTHDVNAAIEGLQRIGFTEIVIKDIHSGGTNLMRRLLLPHVRYEPGFHLSPVPLLGSMNWAHCAVLLGFHARAGSEDAFYPFTFMENIAAVLINGKPVGETELIAGLLGELGIPVSFVSGDAVTVSQAKAMIPWLETLEVPKDQQNQEGGKEGATAWIRKRNEIRAQVERACARNNIPKFTFQKPTHIDIVFHKEADARFHNTWGLQQVGKQVSWESPNFMAAFGQFLRLLYVPRPMDGVANYLFRFTNFVNRTVHGV